MSSERRHTTRVEITLPAAVTGMDTHGSTFNEQSRTFNLSQTGAFLELDHDVRVGSQLIMKLSQPFRVPANPHSQNLVRYARVIWKRQGEFKRWKVAVHFATLLPFDPALI